MITAASLKVYTAKDLAQMAKKRGVHGWHSMRKEQLIRAIVQFESKSHRNGGKSSSSNGSAKRAVAKSRGDAKSNGMASNNSQSTAASKKPAATRRLRREHERRERLKDISEPKSNGKNRGPVAPVKDRVVLMVRDPYWLHAYWEIGSRAVTRARAAMAELWHTAKPVLRLLEVVGNTTGSAERLVRDIDIHGGVKNWYIDVPSPTKSYRVEVGYLASSGKFYALARSNAVLTPRPSSSDMVDHNWADVADNCEKIFALSGGYSQDGGTGELQELLEERLRRPIGSPMVTKFGRGAEAGLEKRSRFSFELDAEMIVFGVSQPDAHVTLGGEPIKLQPDGSFTVRISMPEGRQVLPVVSSSADGMEQQTIVLAVERNTKAMEPVIRDSST